MFLGAADSHQTILVVDDDPGIRQFLNTCLQSAGYEVLTAPDGPEAMHLLGRSSPRIDLLVADLEMPGMTGSELAAASSRAAASPPVLLISGNSAAARDLDGRWEFLPKPLVIHVLLDKIRRMLEASVSKCIC
jgi:two-component system response regulator MprA